MMTRAVSIVCAAVLACGIAMWPVIASASPASEIAAARSKAAVALERLDDLAADLEERNEEYLEVTDTLERTRRQASQAQRELSQAAADLEESRAQLTHRVRSMYRNGSLSIIDVFVGASDFNDLVSRVDLMRRVGLSDAAIVARVKVARDDLDRSSRALAIREEELTVLKRQATAKQSEVEDALNAQKSYLSELNSKLRALIVAEEKRKEEEAARLAAERAAAAAASRAVAGGRSFDSSALGAARPSAVSVARRYVGKTPYLWGGTTPLGFDCSGLVQYCYREIGVTLPRTSRQQYLVGAFIPSNRLDLLLPGDLVFFGRDGNPGRIHHVGMYIGGGDMIHAPQTGELVKVASLVARIQSRGDYVGACRP